jgi:diguanylate cyclase (GGDEF)-like protein
MIEVLCVLSGAIAGFALAAHFFLNQVDRSHARHRSASGESERLDGLAHDLVELTHRVSADVSAHTDKVADIAERLRPAEIEVSSVLSSISELIEVNKVMQAQLADARTLLLQQSRPIEVAVRKARTDLLTGLPSRSELDEYLIGCIQSVPREEISGLLMLDIDLLKKINDTFGHATGDTVLSSFANCILQWCNGKYFAARYGGEEFVVILTGMSLEVVVQKAAELRAHVSERTMVHDGQSLTFTASGGLTMLLPGDTAQAAYQRADKGLQVAKDAGRDCGFWLNADQWVRFSLTEAERVRTAAAQERISNESNSAGESTTSLAQPVSNEPPQHPPAEPAIRESKEGKDGTAQGGGNTPETKNEHRHDSGPPADILDLGTFLQKLDVHLKQLLEAALPATAFLLKAEGLEQLSPGDDDLGWRNTLSIVQSHVRGIDVLGHSEKHCLCIFLPGTSLKIGIEHAGRMQQGLAASQEATTPTSRLPQRFSIALATAERGETPEGFMQRLESALATAPDAKPDEIVVHDGKSCRIQTA